MASNDDAIQLGILTGISYMSGIDYYKGINEAYIELMEVARQMKPNPRFTMLSVDCDPYVDFLSRQEYDSVSNYLASNVGSLVAAGCNTLAIASNTGHLALPEVYRRFPQLSNHVIHIVDCTAAAIKQKGLTSVGLLGTTATMQLGFWKEQLAKHGVETIVPDLPEQNRIYEIICQELSFNVFKDDSREFLHTQAKQLLQRGAQGVVLGCTELELLLKPSDCPDIQTFPSAQLHIETIAQVLAGKRSVCSLMPAE